MKHAKVLVCQILVLMLGTLLSGGCDSNQQVSCQQEKLELQKTIEAQKAEIISLKEGEEGMLELLSGISAEWEKCNKQVAKLEREKEILKKTEGLTPRGLKKGLAELEALRQDSTKRLTEKAQSQANEEK